MKRGFTLLISLTCMALLPPVQLKSQSIIRGIVKNVIGKRLPFANVLLLKQTDSSLVKGTTTDESGKYLFENILNGTYFLAASFAGMEQTIASTIEVMSGNINVDTIYLQAGTVELSTVTVAIKKPMIEQKIDRTIINVKNSITAAGGNALDILEKSPGVTINRQNNSIAINGKSGLTVMINGKITYMQMEALMQLLSSTSADNIDKIELITIPPAKYDAAGNAGYINIVFINNPFRGYNGSYFVSGGYGKKETGTAGINFIYRNANIDFFGNYGYRHDHFIQPSTGYTQFTKAGAVVTNTSFSNRDAVQDLHSARTGLDYHLDSSNTIGILVSGYISHWTMNADNGASIFLNNHLDTVINTFNNELNEWKNIIINLNYQHIFKPGTMLSVDANYIWYRDNNPNSYINNYYNGPAQFLSREELKSLKVTPIKFYVFSSHYTSIIGKKISLETGAKISLSAFNNNAGLYKLKEGIYVADISLTANYSLHEKIAAAYSSISFNPDNSLSLKGGLRYEYTFSNLSTARLGSVINRKYGAIFPTFYISKKIGDDQTIQFAYNRRITRPAFTDLAPFTIFFDPKTFFTGNAALQPAIANTIQSGYSFKNYIFTIGYTYEQGTIESYYFQTQKIDTLTNILYLSANNFRHEQYLTFNFSNPFSITSWWTIQNNLNASWRKIAATYHNAPIQYKIFEYNINSTQRFVLPKDFSVELTGFYSSAGYFGTTKFKPLFRIDAGLQKKSGNQKDVLRLAVNDLFNSGSNYRFSDHLAIANATIERNFNFGVMACRLTFTHNFGNKYLKGKNQRSISADTEINRVHN